MCVNKTPTHTARTDAHSVSAHHTAQSGHFSSREHAWLKITDLCAENSLSSTRHVSFLAAPDTDHQHKFSLTYSPISQSSSSTHPSLLSHDPYTHCDDSRRSCSSSDSQSPTVVVVVAMRSLDPEPDLGWTFVMSSHLISLTLSLPDVDGDV